MKKLLSIIFAFVLIFSCFAVTAFAEDMAIEDDFNIFEEKQPTITFSEDYQKLYVDGEQFSRFDASTLSADFGYTVLVEYEYNSDYYTGHSAFVKLTDNQKENIADILIETNLAKNMYRIEFYFNDGSSLTVYFLKDTYFDEYNNVISGNAEHYLIDFLYPDGNIVTTQKSALFGEAVTFSRNDLLDLYDFYYVTAANSDGTISVSAGQLFSMNDEFYYMDYAENGFNESDFFISEVDECIVHKVTGEILLADLQEAEQRYYEDDYGYLYDDDATDSISAVFLIFIFAVVPAVILIISLIRTIRGKGTYKKIYGTITALCVAELIVFTIIAVIIASSNPADPSAPDYILGESNGEEYVVVDTDYNNEEFNDWYSL